MSHEKRIAQNEAFFRDLNERKAEWLSNGLPAAGFRCECWRLDCSDYIRLSNREWEEVRSEPTHFAVVPGHTASGVGPGVEVVVKRYSHFWIVGKRGKAGREAEKLE